MAVVLTVLGFIWWWPLGLLLLGFLIARRRYGHGRGPMYSMEGMMMDGNPRAARWERKVARAQDKMERARAQMDRFMGRGAPFGSVSSGNAAFDDYRERTLKRLEEEQHEFKDFLERLRLAKDRAEFDQFMAARRPAPIEPDLQSSPAPVETGR